MSLDRPILSKGIFDILFDSVSAIADKAGGLVVSAAEGIGSGISSAVSGVGDVFGKVASVSLGSVSSVAPEPAVAKVREPEIAVAAAKPMDRSFDVSPDQLGTLAPPALPMGVGRSNGGMMV